MALIALFLLADMFFLSASFYGALPVFTVTAVTLVGFVIGLLWYIDLKSRAKTKQKRKAAMAVMGINLVLCIIGTAVWLIDILKKF